MLKRITITAVFLFGVMSCSDNEPKVSKAQEGKAVKVITAKEIKQQEEAKFTAKKVKEYKEELFISKKSVAVSFLEGDVFTMKIWNKNDKPLLALTLKNAATQLMIEHKLLDDRLMPGLARIIVRNDIGPIKNRSGWFITSVIFEENTTKEHAE